MFKNIVNIYKKFGLIMKAINEIKINEDGSLYVGLNNNVIVETKGSIVINNGGLLITKSKSTHINPDVEIPNLSEYETTEQAISKVYKDCLIEIKKKENR